MIELNKNVEVDGIEINKIYNNNKKFIVLDVEGYNGIKPYNVGYMVVDRNGIIYKKVSLALIDNVAENLNYALRTGICKEMTSKNCLDIMQNKVKYFHCNSEECKNLLLEDIERYQVKKIWSYNVNFDKRSMGLLGDFGIEWCDIITAILPKLLTKKYVKFCKKNGYITEKGNIQYKAEIVYRYLFKDNDFVEEHTGLEDCGIEYQILLKSFKSGHKVESEPQSFVYKKFLPFL